MRLNLKRECEKRSTSEGMEEGDKGTKKKIKEKKRGKKKRF